VVKRLVDCVVVVACVAIGGCGSGANKNDGGSGGSGGTNVGVCSPFTPCGGNLVGSWRLVSACGSFTSTFCPPSQSIDVDTTWTDTIYTFAADGTFTFTASGSTSETIRYPPGCLSSLVDAGASEACAAYQDLIHTTIQNADAGTPIANITTFTCTMQGSYACLCHEVIAFATPQTETGTYTTSGTQVTVTATGGTVDAGASGANPSSTDYCVSGNTITLRSASTDNSTGQFVLTKTN
jgi:hypothetical protein